MITEKLKNNEEKWNWYKYQNIEISMNNAKMTSVTETISSSKKCRTHTISRTPRISDRIVRFSTKESNNMW